jgi:hypothetical protein
MEEVMTHASNAALAGLPDAALVPGRDLFEVARYLVPMDASLAQGCLVAAGIPAVLADAHLMQAHMLLAPALGGVRILVPQEHLQESPSGAGRLPARRVRAGGRRRRRRARA